MKINISHMKRKDAVIQFSPPLSVYRSIFIDNSGPKFTVYIDDFNMAVASSTSMEHASDRAIKDIFKLWDIAVYDMSNSDPRVLKIKKIGLEVPLSFISNSKSYLDEIDTLISESRTELEANS